MITQPDGQPWYVDFRPQGMAYPVRYNGWGAYKPRKSAMAELMSRVSQRSYRDIVASHVARRNLKRACHLSTPLASPTPGERSPMTLFQVIVGLIICAICLPLGLLYGLACVLENRGEL